jgi:hypothetical protein
MLCKNTVNVIFIFCRKISKDVVAKVFAHGPLMASIKHPQNLTALFTETQGALIIPFSMAQEALEGHGLLIIEFSRSH